MADIVWYIVFTEEDVGPHWIHRVLKKGFFHCYCFYIDDLQNDLLSAKFKFKLQA